MTGGGVAVWQPPRINAISIGKANRSVLNDAVLEALNNMALISGGFDGHAHSIVDRLAQVPIAGRKWTNSPECRDGNGRSGTGCAGCRRGKRNWIEPRKNRSPHRQDSKSPAA